MRKKVLFMTIVTLSMLMFNVGCIYAIRYDGTYIGKVIDAESGEPIEGAVVLGTWYTVSPTVAGGVSSYYDARETVTDKNGEFSIPGMGLRVMSNLEPMDFLIFKSGYEHISAPWQSLKLDILLSKKIKWEGDKPVIPIKRLTKEERRKRIPSPDVPTEAPLKKVRLMLKELNKESIELGLEPINIWGGEKVE